YAAVVARERVDRQALDRSAGFDAANGRAPAVVLERTIDVHSHRISRVRPGVAAVIARARLFLEVELFDRVALRSVRCASEETRHRESEVLGIVGLPQRAPRRIVRRRKD